MTPKVDGKEGRLCSLILAEEELVSRVAAAATQHAAAVEELRRGSLLFAAKSVERAALSRVDLCFVPHEAGEQEAWHLEQEPEPLGTDAWARMCVPKVSRLALERSAATGRGSCKFVALCRRGTNPALESPDNGSLRSTSRASLQPPSQPSPAARNRIQSAGKLRDPRAFPISEEVPFDDVEDALRLTQLKAEALNRAKEEQRRKREELEEAKRLNVLSKMRADAEKGPCTYDANGRVIWIQETAVEKLPRVSETLEYSIDPDAHARASCADRSGCVPPKRSTAGKSQRRQHHRKRMPAQGGHFTDGFQRPLHPQPPLIDTIELSPGVVLSVNGKKKSGPLPTDQCMTWLEYARLIGPRDEKEGSIVASAGSELDGNPVEVACIPPLACALDNQPAVLRPVSAPDTEPVNSTAQRFTEPYKPIQVDARANIAVTATREVVLAPLREETCGGVVQMAPQAPPRSVRSKSKEASLGHVSRPPRYHVATLGQNCADRPAQPPLGATMGHGLQCGGASQDKYFFPQAAGQKQRGAARPAAAHLAGRGCTPVRAASESALQRPRTR